MLEIRTLLPEETELLHRFLERSFGHGWGWFYRRRPALARVESMAENSLVGIHRGEIVSHVGMYPIPIVAGPARVMCGGIGSVTTAPEARGRGYMSQLLRAAIAHMSERGWPISVLWGDRRRYTRFGWERAGALLHMTLNRRSLAGFEPVPLDDVDPSVPDHVGRVAEWHARLPYRVERPHLDAMLQAADMRLFIGPDGYLIATGARGGDLTVIEVSSPTGKEAQLVAAALNRADAQEATLIVEPVPSERTERLLAAAAHWYLESRAMFRILHWPTLLQAVAPLLSQQAKGLPPFSVSITCYDDTEIAPETTATVHWDGQRATVTDGPGARTAVRLEARDLIRHLLGVPTVQYEGWGMLRHALPLPLHIPRLDFV